MVIAISKVSSQSWSNIAYKGKQVSSITVNKSNKLFICGAMRALTTSDGGITWDSLVSQGYDRTYQKIIVTDSNYLAFSLGSSFGSFAGVFLSRSSDGTLPGNTTRIMGPNDFFVNKKHHFFYTSNTNELPPYTGNITSLSKTTDYGSHYTTSFSVLSQQSQGAQIKMVESSTSGSMVLCFSGTGPRGTMGWPDSSQIYRSSDNGTTWTRTHLTKTSSFLSAITCDKNGAFYLIRIDSAVGAFLLKSVDDGLTWTSTSITATEIKNAASARLLVLSNGTLVFCDKNYNKAFLMFSTDGGTTWVKSTTGLPTQTYFYDIVADNNNVIYLATGDGVYKNMASTDVKEISSCKNDISVYPNPATDEIVFTISNSFKSNIINIKIFDVTGKLCKTENLITNRLDISSLGKGIYFVNILLEDQTMVTKKIIKL